MILGALSKTIGIDVFGVTIYLIDTEGEMTEWAAKNWPDEKHERDAFADLWDRSHGTSMHIEVYGQMQLVMMIKNRRHGTVCHEAVHMAGHVMDHIGMPWCTETDEARAYLTDYIFRATCGHLGLTIEGHDNG